MTQKTALVTGASSDIGQSICLKLIESGLSIGAHYYKNEEALHELEKAALAANVSFFPLCYDLTLNGQAHEMVQKMIQHLGRIDILVNTVGPFYGQDILSVSPEEWQQAIQLNLNTCFNVTYYAKEYLLATSGHIINFGYAGVESLKAKPTSTAYCAAKAGIIILTKSLATAFAPHGVRVNALCPGLIEAGEIASPERQDMAEQIPMKRPGKPEEVAETLKWLILDSPSYITGASIAISGAWEY